MDFDHEETKVQEMEVAIETPFRRGRANRFWRSSLQQHCYGQLEVT